MALQSPFWSTNVRLQQAAENRKPMRVLEPDRAAVRLLQTAIVTTGIANITVDGGYGQETARAIRAIETRFNLDRDEGVAARQSLGVLDILLQGGSLGSDLARTDVPLATRKITAAINALTLLVANPQGVNPVNNLTVDALRAHFRLTQAVSTIGVSRPFTTEDLNTIIERYTQLLRLYAASATRFRTGAPVNGIFTAAEAPINGPVTFGPAYTNVNSNFGAFIGPNSRVAVVIHEGVHVFDRVSGRDDIHISEFNPAYDRQSADLSLHNPSSFAGFAAHIDLKRDPNPRFGLGRESRGL